jgi:hypothetical protein
MLTVLVFPIPTIFSILHRQCVKGNCQGGDNSKPRVQTGSVMLFDEAGSLTSYSVKRNGQNVFMINCDNSSQCLASWSDQFDTYSGCWGSDSIGVAGGRLLLSSNKTEKFSIFEPPLPIDLSSDFELHTVIPTTEKTHVLVLF